MRDLCAARVLQVGFALRLQQFHDLHPHPSDGPGFRIDGPAPLRLMLVGAGLGVGYGVGVTGLALPGQLACLVAQRLGRGVIVDNHARPGLPLIKTVRALASADLRGVQAVVYLPAFTDVTRGAGGRWAASLDELIETLRRSAGHRIPIVLAGLPHSQGVGALAEASRSLAAKHNGEMARRAARDPMVAYVPMPPIGSLAHGPVFDAGYYLRSAELIAHVLVDAAVTPLRRSA